MRGEAAADRPRTLCIDIGGTAARHLPRAAQLRAHLGRLPWRRPFRKGKTYEDLLGDRALARLGKKKWNRMLARAIAQLERTFNFDALYLGGGNSARVTIDLPPNVKRVDNVLGLLGGVKLWEQRARRR